MITLFRTRLLRVMLGLALALLGSANVWAHKASDAYLSLTLPPALQGATLESRWDIALRDLDRDLLLDSNDNNQLEWGEVTARWADIQARALASLALETEGQACQAQAHGVPQLETRSDGRYAVLLHTWRCPAALQTLQLRYKLFADTDPTHRGLLVTQQQGQAQSTQRVQVVPPSEEAVTLTAPDSEASRHGFMGFVLEGVHHILIGTDHVLFLLALLLPAVLVRARAGPTGRGHWQPAPHLKPVLLDVLRVVTAFTVAHSITLGLAVYDVVNPPSRWIESIIAASVILAALNNLYPVVGPGRWKLTFVFGLIHGFGFANALKEVGLQDGGLAAPLLGFNLGVELGQLAIVLVFMLQIWPLRRHPVYRFVLRWGSVAVALMASLWLLERVFDFSMNYSTLCCAKDGVSRGA